MYTMVVPGLLIFASELSKMNKAKNMQTINKEEYGTKVYLNFNRDISTATALTMKFKPEVGADIDVTPTLETSDTWVDDEQLTANYFASYTVTDGMFDNYVGRYKLSGTAKIGSAVYAANPKLLNVIE